jgi:hypothetical protein
VFRAPPGAFVEDQVDGQGGYEGNDPDHLQCSFPRLSEDNNSNREDDGAGRYSDVGVAKSVVHLYRCRQFISSTIAQEHVAKGKERSGDTTRIAALEGT